MPPLVFVDIDTQADFLESDGSLFIPGSGAIRSNLAALTRAARDWGIPVIATACAHTLDEDDPEPFPPHCLVGTPGQGRIPETDRPGGTVLAPTETLAATAPWPQHLTLEKTRYDVFSRPDAVALFARIGQGRPLFVVYGVATDYCVRAAVLGLRRVGHRVAVVADAIWPIDREREPEQLAAFVAAGAELTIAEVALGWVAEPSRAAGVAV